jgi:hypothetical protein
VIETRTKKIAHKRSQHCTTTSKPVIISTVGTTSSKKAASHATNFIVANRLMDPIIICSKFDLGTVYFLADICPV